MADDDSMESLFACQAENDDTPQIISRQDAIALGFVTYFTGKPCKNRHIAERNLKGDCCECHRQRTKTNYEDNKEKVLKQQAEYYAKNKEKILLKRKEYQKSQKGKQINKNFKQSEKGKLCIKRWQNSDSKRKYQNNYNKQRKRTDILYWLSCNLRTRINTALTRDYKSGSTVNDLGCSIEFLKKHLEMQFVEGMTWENRGKVWVIDHIEPLVSFDLTIRIELLKAVHYTNLRPLFKKDNAKKSFEDKKKSIQKSDLNYSCIEATYLLKGT